MDNKTPPIWTVTQLNGYIKDFLENLPPLRRLSVKGEISNLTLHKTGHVYLTLKDEGSVIKTVMFRSDAAGLTFVPKSGDKVIVTGRVSAFVRDGVYQLYATEMEKDGVGSLYAAFEKLKAKLLAEGLFESTRKRPLPMPPFSLGIVTAPTGAAVRDMIHISKRRFPGCVIRIFPSLVQGTGAAPGIIKGIEYFNQAKNVEIIIIGRGGGSIEDLWAFNDEALARAVYHSEIPVISAVGHETDFTITDFVADLRAPTPSAAVEMALPDLGELLKKFENVKTRLSLLLTKHLETEKRLFKMLSSSAVLTLPERLYQDKMLDCAKIGERLERLAAEGLEKRRSGLSALNSLLHSFNPLGVLSRGYSVAYDARGNILYQKDSIQKGENFTLKLSDGEIFAVKTGSSG